MISKYNEYLKINEGLFFNNFQSDIKKLDRLIIKYGTIDSNWYSYNGESGGYLRQLVLLENWERSLEFLLKIIKTYYNKLDQDMMDTIIERFNIFDKNPLFYRSFIFLSNDAKKSHDNIIRILNGIIFMFVIIKKTKKLNIDVDENYFNYRFTSYKNDKNYTFITTVDKLNDINKKRETVDPFGEEDWNN